MAIACLGELPLEILEPVYGTALPLHAPPASSYFSSIQPPPVCKAYR
jgi:hypothetical protein